MSKYLQKMRTIYLNLLQIIIETWLTTFIKGKHRIKKETLLNKLNESKRMPNNNPVRSIIGKSAMRYHKNTQPSEVKISPQKIKENNNKLDKNTNENKIRK